MSAYAFYYKDQLNNKHGINPGFFYKDGCQMVHHEVDGVNGEVLSGEHNDSHLPEHHFTLYKGNNTMSWIVLLPLNKLIAKLKTRFICNEVDLKLSEKIHDYIENFAGRKGFRQLTVHTAPAGLGFYNCMGFRDETAFIQENGSVMYVMKKEI